MKWADGPMSEEMRTQICNEMEAYLRGHKVYGEHLWLVLSSISEQDTTLLISWWAMHYRMSRNQAKIGYETIMDSLREDEA